MKKYIKPAIVEVKLDNENILAASDPSLTFGTGTTTTMEAADLDLDTDLNLGWDEEL